MLADQHHLYVDKVYVDIVNHHHLIFAKKATCFSSISTLSSSCEIFLDCSSIILIILMRLEMQSFVATLSSRLSNFFPITLLNFHRNLRLPMIGRYSNRGTFFPTTWLRHGLIQKNKLLFLTMQIKNRPKSQPTQKTNE